MLAKKFMILYNSDMEIKVYSVTETNAIAKELALKLNGNEIILLNGDLGAGKTTFTKALAAALGVTDTVTSPTFAFMREYYGKYKISHYDMYRATDEDELFELGIADNLYEDGLCIIEWNKYKQFPDNKKIITINISKIGDNARIFNIDGLEKAEE